MYPPIFAVCAANAAVTEQLGAAPVRLYPFGQSPQGSPLPYAVWQVISGSPENYLAGRPDLDGFTLQVDVYADSAASARSVTAAIRNAIELHAHIVRWSGESRDDETGRYRISFDVDWLTQR